MMKAADVGKAVAEIRNTRPVSRDEAKCVLAALIGETRSTIPVSELETSAAAGIIHKRLSAFAPQSRERISNHAIVLAAVFSDRPGFAVMLAAALHWLATTQEHVGVQDLILRVLPEGVPTPNGLNPVWLSQKRDDAEFPGSDNWLDYKEAWQ